MDWSEFGHGDVSLRRWRPTDAAFCAEVYATTRDEEMKQSGWSIAVQRRFLAEQHRLRSVDYARTYPEAEDWVITRRKTPIGYLLLTTHPTCFRVIALELLPSWRGQGVGTALIRHLQTTATATGRQILLQVRAENRARTWYARMGFDPERQHGGYWHLRWVPESRSAGPQPKA